MAILLNTCFFAFAAIQAIAASFTIWDRVRSKQFVAPDLSSRTSHTPTFTFW
jgi:hypothetical protein